MSSHGHDVHSHDNSGHDHSGHRIPRGIALLAAATFAVLSIWQLVEGYHSSLAAISVDGLHNLVDGVMIALNAIAIRHEHRQRWAVGVPFLSTVIIVIASIGVVALETSNPVDTTDVRLALVLSAISLVVNLGYAIAMRYHSARLHGEHPSLNALIIERHLWGDALAVILAVAAYVIVLVGGPLALDVGAAVAGTIVIAWMHWKIAQQSLRQWLSWNT